MPPFATSRYCYSHSLAASSADATSCGALAASKFIRLSRFGLGHCYGFDEAACAAHVDQRRLLLVQAS